MSYEFSEEENEVFLDLTRNMITLSMVIGIVGSISMLQYFFDKNSLYSLTYSLSFIALAIAIYLPISNFKRIVISKGSDIKELIDGLRSASNAWLVANIIFALNRIVLIILMFQVIRD